MDSIQSIFEQFPELSPKQKQQFTLLQSLYPEWNSKINVISRKDIEHLNEKHCLHSLGIAKVYQFLPGQKILDVGTGGGFPGIPLAILYPETDFTLVDTINKKITVVDAISQALGLRNVTAIHQRAEKVEGKYHFVVSRAVTRMRPFYQWVFKKVAKGADKQGFRYGILYLKGGDLQEEMSELGMDYQLFNLRDYFQTPFFETKKVVYLPMS